MFDPISLATGAALLVTGFGAGRFRRPTREPKKPTAACGCGHTLAHHDPATNQCHGQELRRDCRNKQGDWIGNQWVPCTCRRYVGPVPVESLFATPTLPPVDGG
jgi:hypothetical protein